MKTMTMYRPNTIQGLLGCSNPLSEFDRCLDTFFGSLPLAPTTKGFDHLPAVDVRETEKAYVLDMELPGYKEKDIDIHVDGNKLSIVSKQEENGEKKDEDQGTWIIKERQISSFKRSFKLPDNANPEEVTAEFKNGVLSMEIKKRAEAQRKAIEIKVA